MIYKGSECAHCWQTFIKYAVEMGSGAVINITGFLKDWFRSSEVDGHIRTHAQHCRLRSLLSFIQNKESEGT
jgi:Fe-S oxidoreductase